MNSKSLITLVAAVVVIAVAGWFAKPYAMRLLRPVKNATLVTDQNPGPEIKNENDAVYFSAPVTDATGVYVVTNSNVMFGVNLDLKARWYLPMPSAEGGSAIAPALADDSVTFFLKSGRVLNLAKEDGKVHWVLDDQGEFKFRASSIGDSLYYASIKGKGPNAHTVLVKVDLATGKQVWKVKVDGIVSSRVLNHADPQTISLTTEDNELISFNKSDGQVAWHLKLESKPVAVFIRYKRLTVVLKDTTKSIDADTGKEVWANKLISVEAVYDDKSDQIVSQTPLLKQLIRTDAATGSSRTQENPPGLLTLRQPVPEGVMFSFNGRMGILDINTMLTRRWAKPMPGNPKSYIAWQGDFGYAMWETGELRRIAWENNLDKQ